ncbi:MAG: hypothetical protein WAJ94_09465 [Candidatus Cybelea sp.]
MKGLASFFAAVLLLAAASPPKYQIDLARYFPNAATELRIRAAAIAGAQAFAESLTPVSAPALLHWLQQYDALLRSLERHDIYAYLKSEQDDRDAADAKADDALGEAEDLVIGLAYLLTDSLARAVHRLDPAEAKSVAVAVTATLDAAAASYKASEHCSTTRPFRSPTSPRAADSPTNATLRGSSSAALR